MMQLELERMGSGHAMTVSLTWKLNAGELTALKTQPAFRTDMLHTLANDAQHQILTHLADYLRKAKDP